MVVQFDHVNLVRKINTDNSAYLFENYYTVSNKPHSSTYMFICEFWKLFKFIWLIFNLDSCQKLTNTKSIQLPGGNNPNAWCIGRPKITTTPRFQNANFHFYHELIPKAAMMKRIPKWKHEGNSGLRKCDIWWWILSMFRNRAQDLYKYKNLSKLDDYCSGDMHYSKVWPRHSFSGKIAMLNQQFPNWKFLYLFSRYYKESLLCHWSHRTLYLKIRQPDIVASHEHEM